MATATQAKPSEQDRLRKLARLWDSNNPGERSNAFNMVVRQCAEHDPPKLIWKAICEAFGGGNNADQDQMKADFYELKTVASRLNDENGRLLQEVDRLRLLRAASEWPPAWFVQPKPLLFALGIAVAMEWLLLLPSWELPEPDAFLLVQWAHTICMGLFLLWSMALFKCEGSKRLALGWLTWGSAWFFLVAIHAAFHGGFHKNAFRIGVMAAPLHWWGAVRMGSAANNVVSPLIALAFVIDLISGAPVMLWAGNRLIQLATKLLEWAVFLFGALREVLVDE